MCINHVPIFIWYSLTDTHTAISQGNYLYLFVIFFLLFVNFFISFLHNIKLLWSFCEFWRFSCIFVAHSNSSQVPCLVCIFYIFFFVVAPCIRANNRITFMQRHFHGYSLEHKSFILPQKENAALIITSCSSLWDVVPNIKSIHLIYFAENAQ